MKAEDNVQNKNLNKVSGSGSYGNRVTLASRRRSTLKAVLAGSAAFSVPSKWMAPVVDAVTLPAHAVTSPGEVPPSGESPATTTWFGGVSLVSSNNPRSPLKDFSEPGSGLFASLGQLEKIVKQGLSSMTESLISPAHAQSVSMLLCVTADGSQLSVTGQYTISGEGQAISLYVEGAGPWGSEMILTPDCGLGISDQIPITWTQGPGTAISYQLDIEGNSFSGTIPQGPCAIPGECTFPDQ